jgi:hypothetical protein
MLAIGLLFVATALPATPAEGALTGAGSAVPFHAALEGPVAAGGEDVMRLAGEVVRLALEVRGLREQLALMDLALKKRDEALAQMGQELHAVGADMGALKDRLVSPVAAAFIAGPPPSSDAVGVAKAVVFAPRVEADLARRREIVSLRVRRIEAGEIKRVSEVELGGEPGVDLPLDQNGALYIVDWSTTEGATFNLVLRDGISGQAAATVQVKLQQSQGRFLFVGCRID